MTAEWISAMAAILLVGVAVVGAIWKGAKAIDKNTLVTDQILKTMEVQWKRIDEHTEDLKLHEKKLTDLEAWKKYHEKGE